MSNIKKIQAISLALLVHTSGAPVFSQENPAALEVSKPKPTLETILQGTIRSNAQIDEAKQQVEVARAQLGRARAAAWPQASAMFIVAPAFEERGNALSSRSNLDKWGAVLSVGAQIVQPLYTFGQLSNYEKAALKQIDAFSDLAKVKRAEMVRYSKELFYGYQMANDLNKLVDSTVSFLEEAVEKSEKSKKDKDSNIKPHDIYLLKTTLADLKQKGLIAKQSIKTASNAVRWISGIDFDSLPGKKMRPQKFEKRELSQYISLAEKSRPEISALRSGISARKALSEAKRSQSYPVVFVGGFFSKAWSGVHDRQDSLFANDPFNGLQGGLGVGLKFDLEFNRHAAEAAEERAEAMKLEAQQRWAVPGIELQVKKAFWEFEQAEAGLTIAKERRKIAKKWFVSSGMGWSVGITPAKDLMEALKGDAEAKQNYIETVYAYNLALANLSQAVGQEVTELTYK